MSTPQTLNHTDRPAAATPQASAKTQRKVLATMAKRTFCTLATTSPAQRAHSAGVVYEWADDALWVHTVRTSRKGRNIEANPQVGVSIPFRRLPVGPPFTIHFQARATIMPMDAHEVQTLIADDRLQAIAGHGALDMTDGCFVKIVPHGAIHSYGPGARLIDLIRDPLNHGAASFRLDTGRPPTPPSETIREDPQMTSRKTGP